MIKIASRRILTVSSLAITLSVVVHAQSPGFPEQDPDDHSVIQVGPTISMFKHQVDLQNGAENTVAALPHLNYYKGPVIANAQIVEVLYGAGSYLSNITSKMPPNIASFVNGVGNSPYFAWLTEYDTPYQNIGFASFLKGVEITPSLIRDGSVITDAQVKAELSHQIGLGAVPAPTNNTLYMMFFPHGKNISQGGTLSCVQFCAYHGTFMRNGQIVYYGVLPDMSPGSGCEVGCGNNTQYNNQTSVMSHEWVEAVTDAAVGLATGATPAYPLAWYDPNNGEIGDICDNQQATIVGSDGRTYTVQKEWSNASNACIVHK